MESSPAQNNQPQGLKVLITGGSGYVGRSLAAQLVWRRKTDDDRSVRRVVLVDKCTDASVNDFNEDECMVHSHQVDITRYSDMADAFHHVDIVYHLASYGMSGREQLHSEAIWKVNDLGTRNVIRACLEHNVKALIFTSTVNVVFGGQRIDQGDESLPYFPTKNRLWDNYSNSKTEAERAVLQANNSLTKDGSVLRTCSLRLPGIYGPGEQRHMPRIVNIIRQGLLKVTYGDNPIVEFIHLDNVIQGLCCASRHLLKEPSAAAGQTYFISDGAPINNFEFFRPLIEALGAPFPRINLPSTLVYFIAFLIEVFYHLVHPVWDFTPLLTRAEVYKTSQTHNFSIMKARLELGYAPTRQNDLSEICQYYGSLYTSKHAQRHVSAASSIEQTDSRTSRIKNFIVNVFLVLAISCLILSLLPVTK